MTKTKNLQLGFILLVITGILAISVWNITQARIYNPTGGGTIGGSLSGGTNGSVLFVGKGQLTQNNANFFWDNTNNRLGIGTTTPGALLAVHGNGLISNQLNTASLTATGTIRVGTLAAGEGGLERLVVNENVAGSIVFFRNAGTGATAVFLHNTGIADGTAIGMYIDGGGNTGSTVNLLNITQSAVSKFQVKGDGNIGIATSAPASLLSLSSTGTTTIHLGTAQSTTKGSCIQMYQPNGTAVRLYFNNSATLVSEAGSCNSN